MVLITGENLAFTSYLHGCETWSVIIENECSGKYKYYDIMGMKWEWGISHNGNFVIYVVRNVAVEWLAFLLFVCKVPRSNVDPEVDCHT
jgi:hypothetical protein